MFGSKWFFKRRSKRFFLLMLLPLTWFGSANAGLKVDVVVADQGKSERLLAYRLSLAELLQGEFATLELDEGNRRDLLRESSSLVQSFRYRRFDPIAGVQLSTSNSRLPQSKPSILTVTYPAELGELIESRLAPVEVPREEPVVYDKQRILTLIAVDQQGEQYLIGGKTGRKFQARTLQLGAANDMQLFFPELNIDDRTIVSAQDVLQNSSVPIDVLMQRYEASSRLNGALFRLESGAWQSEWYYTQLNQEAQTFRLTTNNLDEALVSVIDEIANPRNVSELGDFLPGSAFAPRRAGVALLVENVNSLRDYYRVLNLVQQIDDSAKPELIQPGSATFRLAEGARQILVDRLSRTGRFLVADASVAGIDPARLHYRYKPR